MTTNLNDISTNSRSEMVCPHCWTRGLVKSDSYAAQCPDDPTKKIINATACSNEDCQYYDGGRANPGRVPPAAIKKQYSSSTFKDITTLFSNPRVTGALTLIVVIVAALVMLGPIFGGGSGGGTAAADTYSNVSESDDGNYSSWQVGNWTVSDTDGGYVVSGYVNGTVVYLDADGGTVDYPVAFDTVSSAEDAISNFETRQTDGITSISDPEPIDWDQESNWSVYQFGEYSVVAGQVNGSTVYLNYTTGSDNITVSSDPTLYNSTDLAYDAIVEWVTATPNDDSSINPTTEDDVQNSLQENDPLNNDDSSSTPDDSDSSTDDMSYTYTSCCDYSYSSSGGSDSNVGGTEEEGSGDGNTVRGSVQDNEGEPVENATVHLYSEHFTTTTDANGEYVFTDVPSGEHHLHIEPPEGTTLASTANVSFQLGADGNMTILNQTSSSTILTVDGEVVENRIAFTLPASQSIEATGMGNDIATELNFENRRNADDIAVTLTPEYTAGLAETDVNSSTGSGTVYIDGNTNPLNSNLTLSGTPGTQFFTENGTGQGIVTIYGNQNTTSQEIILYGREDISEQSVSGTGNGTIDNRGNVESNATLTLSGGNEETTSQTDSGTGDVSLLNNGNVETDATLELSGNEDTVEQSTSATGDGTIENNGNIETEATLTIEGDTNTQTATSSGTINDGEATTFTVDGTDTAQNAELQITGQETLGSSHSSDTLSFSVRHLGVCGSGSSYGDNSWTIPMDSNADQMYVEYEASYDHSGGCEYDYSYAYASMYDSSSNRIYSNSINSEGSFSETGSFYETGDVDVEIGGSSNGASVSGTIDYTAYPVYQPETVRVYLDGVQVEEQYLNDGETVTISLGDIEPGEHEISIVSTGGASVSYDAQWDEQHSTENINIDTNGDGTADFTRTEPLGSGETTQTTTTLSTGTTNIGVTNDGPTPSWSASFTQVNATNDVQADVDNDGTNEIDRDILRSSDTVTQTVGLAPGQNAFTIQHNGPEPNWDASYTEITASENINADLDDDGVAEITHSSPLRESDSITQTVQISPEESSVTINSSGPAPTWSGTLTEINQTENPSLTVGGESVSVNHTGLLGPNEEATVEVAPLEPGDTSIGATAGTGPNPDYQVAYIAQANPESATVLINGNAYEYPADFDETGQIEGITNEVEVNDLSIGENTVTVSTSEIDGIQPEVTATVEHPSEAMQTSEPTIYVTNPSGDIHTHNISNEYITDGQLAENATVELPQSWFENGRNVLVVQTGDGSVVSASVNGTSRSAQIGTFEDTTNLNVTAVP